MAHKNKQSQFLPHWHTFSQYHSFVKSKFQSYEKYFFLPCALCHSFLPPFLLITSLVRYHWDPHPKANYRE